MRFHEKIDHNIIAVIIHDRLIIRKIYTSSSSSVFSRRSLSTAVSETLVTCYIATDPKPRNQTHSILTSSNFHTSRSLGFQFHIQKSQIHMSTTSNQTKALWTGVGLKTGCQKVLAPEKQFLLLTHFGIIFVPNFLASTLNGRCCLCQGALHCNHFLAAGCKKTGQSTSLRP